MPFDVFLKIDGIPGESNDHKHKGEIDVLSWSWSITNPVRGRTTVEDLRVFKPIDAATPLLFDAACAGEPVGRAWLSVRKAGGKQDLEFFKVVLEDVLITSIRTGGNSTSDTVPMEEIAMNFSKIEIEYTEQKEDGSAGGATKSSCSPRRTWPVQKP